MGRYNDCVKYIESIFSDFLEYKDKFMLSEVDFSIIPVGKLQFDF